MEVEPKIKKNIKVFKFYTEATFNFHNLEIIKFSNHLEFTNFPSNTQNFHALPRPLSFD